MEWYYSISGQEELIDKVLAFFTAKSTNAELFQDIDEEIRRLIEAAGARLVYLPPYSPDFSPIENFWSKVKAIFKTLGARSSEALIEAMEIAFSQVSETDIKHWFTHCCYCSLDL